MSKDIRLISIVDDDSVYQFTMQVYAETLNISDKMMYFNHGEEAIAYLNKNIGNENKLPDLILLDMNMPVMDGWQFIEEFFSLELNISKKIVIYMISSSVREEDIQRAKSLSLLSGYLIKPVERENLQQLLAGDYENHFGLPSNS